MKDVATYGGCKISLQLLEKKATATCVRESGGVSVCHFSPRAASAYRDAARLNAVPTLGLVARSDSSEEHCPYLAIIFPIRCDPLLAHFPSPIFPSRLSRFLCSSSPGPPSRNKRIHSPQRIPQPSKHSCSPAPSRHHRCSLTHCQPCRAPVVGLEVR